MTYEHPMRHRLGIVFFCLIALLTARDGSRFPRTRGSAEVASAPLLRPLNVPSNAVREEFVIEQQSTLESILKPLCSLPGNADLPCCTVIPVALNVSNLELELNPEAFPRAWDFVPDARNSIGSAMLIPEHWQQADEAVLARDIWNYPAGWWPQTLQPCPNVKKNKNGEEYCAPEETAQVPEPGALALLLAGALITAETIRRRAHLHS